MGRIRLARNRGGTMAEDEFDADFAFHLWDNSTNEAADDDLSDDEDEKQNGAIAFESLCALADPVLLAKETSNSESTNKFKRVAEEVRKSVYAKAVFASSIRIVNRL